MYIKPEGAQRTRQPGHLAKKLLWMAVLREQQMPQWCKAGIDRVQEPELGYVASGHTCLESAPTPVLFLCEHRALLFQYLN